MSNIKSVEKGYGENSIFFSTDQRVTPSSRVDKIEKISEEVYRGYLGEDLFFEMGGKDITVIFEAEKLLGHQLEQRGAPASLSRRSFLKLPLEERRRILEEQSVQIRKHYEEQSA